MTTHGTESNEPSDGNETKSFVGNAEISKTEKKLDESVVIGIDLGTTNSCASYYIDGNVKVLENQEGSRITPSFVFFTDNDEFIVGNHAKGMADISPSNGVYEVKRLIGKTYHDLNTKDSLKNWPFKVVPAPNDSPIIEIETKNKVINATPVEITTLILKKIKEDVEEKLDCLIEKVVITVPAYFNKTQRQDTLIAAKNAGFDVLKLLNEPTAAALIYYFNKGCEVGDYCLVYDLGGGTFDVAILQKNKDEVQTVAVDGDTNLGGHDFDNSIISFVCDLLLKDYDYDARSDSKNMRRLHKICENAKKILSAVSETTLILEGIVTNHPSIQIPLSRNQFESLNKHLFEKTLQIVDRCLKKAELTPSSIKDIILAGGSTRIPKLQKILSEYFDNRKLSKFVNPDECVSEGAAIQAAMISKKLEQKIETIKIIDVTPLSIGVNTIGGLMSFVIKKNTTIPINSTYTYLTVYDKQSSMSFDIYEGERLEAKKNYFLGNLRISDITPAPPGQCKITLTMNIDANGILTITAKEKYGIQTKTLEITYGKDHISDSDVQTALIDASENVEEDAKFEKFAKRKIYLIDYCVRAKYNFENKELKYFYLTVYEKCDEILRLIEALDISQDQLILEKTEEIINLCGPIVTEHQFELMPHFRT